MIADVRITIRDLDDGTETTCTLEDFLRDNEEAEDICEEVTAAPMGVSVRVGGGAAPAFDITKELVS